MKERIEGARPMMDLMAKKIFSNTKITAQFIRDIFDLPVEQVKILESTQIHEFYLDEFPFSTHIDVLAELDDHTQIIIEIQVALCFVRLAKTIDLNYFAEWLLVTKKTLTKKK